MKWRKWVAGLAIAVATLGLGGCIDEEPDNPLDPDLEDVEGEPGNPTEDPDNPLDPTLPDG